MMIRCYAIIVVCYIQVLYSSSNNNNISSNINCRNDNNTPVIHNSYLSCCNEHNVDRLICINNTLNSNNKHLNNNSDNSIIFGTFISPNIFSYASNTLLTNSKYIIDNNYAMHILSSETGDNYYNEDMRWNKIRIIINAMNTWAFNYKYIVFIDADLMILDNDFNINSIINRYNSANIIVTEDSIDIANTGCMIVKNTQWSLDFLELWWQSIGISNTYCDQHVLNILINELRNNNTSHNIAVIPAKEMNSFYPAIDNYRESDPVLHLMGENNVIRNKISQEIAQLICSTNSSSSNNNTADTNTSNDLNITSQLLHNWKYEAMVSEYLHYRSQSMAETAVEQDYEQLHSSIIYMCQYLRNNNSNNTSYNNSSSSSCFLEDGNVACVADCIGMLNDATVIHNNKIAALATAAKTASDNREHPDLSSEKHSGYSRVVSNNIVNVGKEIVFHRDKEALLLFDVMTFTTTPTLTCNSNSNSHSNSNSNSNICQYDNTAKHRAADKVLQSIDALMRLIDMSEASNIAYIHHKRGIVFGSLAEIDHKQKSWDSALEKEKVAISEFATAMGTFDSDTHPDFPGFLLSYIKSSERIAESYRQLRDLEAAYEWSAIALSNSKLLYSNSNNEERIIAQQLLSSYLLCLEVCADMNKWSEYSELLDSIHNIRGKYLVMK